MWRPGPGRDVEILLVHRPKYDDWTLPKGKCGPNEDDLACALREVEEETGLCCRPAEELVSSSYRDSKGRPKTVRYWAMTPLSGSFAPHDEVDDARRLSRREAASALSYRRDREMLASLDDDVMNKL